MDDVEPCLDPPVIEEIVEQLIVVRVLCQRGSWPKELFHQRLAFLVNNKSYFILLLELTTRRGVFWHIPLHDKSRSSLGFLITGLLHLVQPVFVFFSIFNFHVEFNISLEISRLGGYFLKCTLLFSAHLCFRFGDVFQYILNRKLVRSKFKRKRRPPISWDSADVLHLRVMLLVKLLLIRWHWNDSVWLIINLKPKLFIWWCLRFLWHFKRFTRLAIRVRVRVVLTVHDDHNTIF